MSNVNYYNEHASEFFEGTAFLDMSHIYERFCPYVPVGGRILDAGCGSGRDTTYFSKQYHVDAFDASEEMVKLASEHTNKVVHHATFQTFKSVQKYDGIWCCASMLHVPIEEMTIALRNMRDHLVPYGYLYASFRHGDTDDVNNGRSFTNMTVERMYEHAAQLGFTIIEAWETDDIRPDRTVKWINIILQYTPLFQLMSDLHTEFCEDSIIIHPNSKNINLLVAGDLGTVRAGERYHRMLKKLCDSYKTVTLVAGNHEFYGYNIVRVHEALVGMESEFDNFTYLNKNHTIIDGVHIIGCTLWADFLNGNQKVMSDCKYMMNDYHKIRHGNPELPYDRKLTPTDTLGFNMEHRDYVFNTISQIRKGDPDAKILVLTHHAPLLDSLMESSNRAVECDGAYANDYRELLSQYKPNMWCHGHIHERKNYKYGDTLIRCEPTGYITYRRSEQTDYDPFNTFII